MIMYMFQYNENEIAAPRVQESEIVAEDIQQAMEIFIHDYAPVRTILSIISRGEHT